MDKLLFNANQVISELASARMTQDIKDKLDAAATVAEWLRQDEAARALFAVWYIEHNQKDE